MTDSLPKYWVASVETGSDKPRGWTRHLSAFAEVAFMSADGAPPPARIAWTVQRVREFCDEVGGKAVVVFRLALFGISWVAPLLLFSLPPFRRHTLERRAQIAHRFERSLFGLSVFAVKAMLCMHYFEHPDVAEEVHFDGGTR